MSLTSSHMLASYIKSEMKSAGSIYDDQGRIGIHCGTFDADCPKRYNQFI